MSKIRYASFSYKKFMKLLGLKGEFIGIHDIIASISGPTPRIEIEYRQDLEESITKA